MAIARDYWSEVVSRNVEILNATVRLYRFERKILKDPDAFDNGKNQSIKFL